MASISFVIVKPGKRATAAAQHDERVEIHSHAQRVTQHRKRIQKLKQAEKHRSESPSRPHETLENQDLIERLRHDPSVGDLLDMFTRKELVYGLPTPSPEPDFDRPLSGYSSWTEDHKYGMSMFVHMTILDINEVATNMAFWKVTVPSYAEVWVCVRDIVSAISCANQAIQTRDEELILKALRLHLHAITTLRRDLASLPLSAQVGCCLLFDAFNILRCDFVQAGTQIAIARQLTSAAQLDDYLKDERLATVYDALNRMSQSSAWSLWNPSYFLGYEGLRHAEPNLYIELQPIDHQDGTLKGLVQSMERLSRHFSGRIRRNLSEDACVAPESTLAQDVLHEFQIWRNQFDDYIRRSQHEQIAFTPTERATIQQVDLAWNFTYITFTTGVLNSDLSIYDDPIYTPYYNRINDLAAQRFHEIYQRPSDLKAFLQIIVPSLWLVILMCRDRTIRKRSIAILKSQSYQEGDFNSLVAGQMAEIIVQIENESAYLPHHEQAMNPSHTRLHNRIQVEGIKYVTASEEVILSYSYISDNTTTSSSSQPHRQILQRRIPWKLHSNIGKKEVGMMTNMDTIKFSNAILALSQACMLYRKVKAAAALEGYLKPMYYKGERVQVCTMSV